MDTRRLLLNGRTRDDVIDDATARGVHGRLVLLDWPPLRDEEAWERLHALRSEETTTFAARLFPKERVTTKAYDEYLERYFRFVDSAAEFDEGQTIHGLSSTSRTCKTCGSHVSVEYVRGEACPICGSDLRSNTVHKTLDRWRERIAKVREQGEAEAAKAGWLGSWGAVTVEGRPGADDPAEARRRNLLRRYDSETIFVEVATDEEPLYLPGETLERLTSAADERGISPAAYLEELIARIDG